MAQAMFSPLVAGNVPSFPLTAQVITAIVGTNDALHFGGRIKWVVINDGNYGLFASQGTQVSHRPAYQDPGRPILDDLGAGDACMAGIVHAWLDRFPLEDTLMAGARLGYETCTDYGAVPRFSSQALREYLSINLPVPA